MSLVSLVLLAALELPVSDLRYGATRADVTRGNAHVAAGTEGFAVVWEAGEGLAARTFDRFGVPRQPAEVPLVNGDTPLVVADGGEYIIYYSAGVLVQSIRLRANGTIVENSERLMHSGSEARELVDVAVNGTRTLLITNARFAPELILLHLQRAVALPGLTLLAVAPLGDGFLLIAGDSSDLVAVPVNASGVLGRAKKFGTNDVGTRADVAIDVDPVIVYNTRAGTFAVRLDSALDVAESITLSTSNSEIGGLVRAGDAWLTAWSQGGTDADLVVARFEAGGVLETKSVQRLRAQTGPHLAAGSGASFLAWTSAHTAREPDTIVTKLIPHGALPVLEGEVLASESALPQTQITAAADAGGVVVAWIEPSQTRQRNELHVSGFNANGARRPEQIIDAVRDQTGPRLASAGSQSLLVWIETLLTTEGTIRALRLDGSGHPIFPTLTLGEGAQVDVASNGTDWLVVWRGGTFEILESRVTANGDVVSFGPIHPSPAHQSFPAIEWDGSEYVVAWSEVEAAGTSPTARHRVRRKRGSGAAEVIAEREGPSNVPPLFGAPSLGCASGRCLVLWREGLEPQPFIHPRENGQWEIYRGRMLTTLAANFDPLFTRPWTSLPIVSVGDVIANGPTPLIAYIRQPVSGEPFGSTTRAFLGAQQVRPRAVRH